jgi:hypothetical protein
MTGLTSSRPSRCQTMLPQLLCLVLLAAGAAKQDSLVYHGPVPRGYRDSRAAMPLRLTRGGHDCLLLQNDTSLAAFAVTESGLSRVGMVPLPALPRDWEVATRWRLRDTDGDSVPEIVVAHDSELWVFEWRDSACGLISIAGRPDRKSWIVDFVFGDVDRCGIEELIAVACDHRPDSSYDHPKTSSLIVCHWRPDGLKVMWTDHGRLGVECASGVVPPSDLIGVYDIRNNGHCELIYEGVESSVGPFTYESFDWEDGAFVTGRSFRLEHCLFADSVPESERFLFVMGMEPFVEDGRTKLSVGSVGGEFYAGERLSWTQTIELHGDTVVSARTVPGRLASRDEGDVIRLDIDPDGRGVGTLRLVTWREMRTQFEFRREPSE